MYLFGYVTQATVFYLSILSVYASAVSIGPYVHVVATPTTVVKNMTTDLSVSCTMPKSQDVQFAAVSSIILFRSIPSGNTGLSEVASIHSGSSVVDVKIPSSYQGAGSHLELGADSYLTVKVMDPLTDGPGDYKCEAFGLDKAGHPMTSSSSTTVQLVSVSTDQLLEMVQDLERNNALLKTEIETMKMNQSTDAPSNFDHDSFINNVTSMVYDVKTYAEVVCTNLSSKIEEVDNMTSGLNDGMVSCLSKISDLSQQLVNYQASTNQSFENLTNGQGSSVSSLYDEITKLENETASFSNALSDYKTQTYSLSGLVTGLRANMSIMAADISSIKANQDPIVTNKPASQTNITSLFSVVAKNQADISQLTKDLETCRANTSSLTGQVSQLQASVSTLSADVTSCNSNITRLTSDVAQCQTSTSAILKDLTDCKTNTSNLACMVNTLQTNTADLNHLVNGHISDLATLTNQLSAFKDNTTTNLEFIHGDIQDIQTLITQFPGSGVTNTPVTGMNTTGLAQHGGHYYFLTDNQHINISAGVDVCRDKKGYLVEINDLGEWEFLKNYIDSKISDNRDYIMVGATDTGHEGTWTFVTSKGQASYLEWSSYHQQSDFFNCMYLNHEITGWKMMALTCGSHYGRILCEIPPPSTRSRVH